MQVTCGDCGKRCSVADDGAPDSAEPPICSMCGALLGSVPAPPGAEPRDQLDTLKLDASSLATLVRLGEVAHATAVGPEAGAIRPPQGSIPFELAQERAVRRTPPRAVQQSIPFELVRSDHLSPRSRAPSSHSDEASIPLDRPRPPPAEDWEGTFATRVRRRRPVRWGTILIVMALGVLVLLLVSIVSGRIDPARWLD